MPYLANPTLSVHIRNSACSINNKADLARIYVSSNRAIFAQSDVECKRHKQCLQAHQRNRPNENPFVAISWAIIGQINDSMLNMQVKEALST